jgi:CDP-4-dehydro-6-deoxyglucose reductase
MTNTVTLFDSDVQFTVEDGQTILDAALSNNIGLGYSCSNGKCGECQSTLISGEVTPINTEKYFTPAEVEILTCCSIPKTDIILKAEYSPELSDIERKTVPAKVNSFFSPVNDVLSLSLRVPPKANFKFLPGQYIDLLWNGKKRSYSIANSNSMNNEVELHIKKVDGGVFSSFLFGGLVKEQLFRLYGPLGTFFLRDNDRPLIFICTGTGFAPIKSMVEYLINSGSSREIYIYWGAQYRLDLYSDLPSLWDKDFQHITFIPALSRQESLLATEYSGYVQNAVVEQHPCLDLFDVYACGSGEMIKSAKKYLVSNGLSETNFYSDAFIASE